MDVTLSADTIDQISRVCHEANRAWCAEHGDLSQLPWEDAPKWQIDSCIDGVRFALENPDAPPSASHDNWLAEKRREGWVYGEEKDPLRKTHPCMVPFEELPAHQQVKDRLFLAIVRALSAG